MEQVREESFRRPNRSDFLFALVLSIPATVLLLWIAPAIDRVPRIIESVTGREHAVDAIIVLQGDADRSAYASFLADLGWAKQILSTRVWPHCRKLEDPPPACLTGVRNTIDEALMLRRLAGEQGMQQVIIVTSRYHLLRAAAVFSIVFFGAGVDLHFIAPPASALPSFQVAVSELAKLIPSIAAAVMGRVAPSTYQPLVG